MEVNELSRRKWLEKITIPALTAGAAIIGVNANASPGDNIPDDKNKGIGSYNVRDFGARGRWHNP